MPKIFPRVLGPVAPVGKSSERGGTRRQKLVRATAAIHTLKFALSDSTSTAQTGDRPHTHISIISAASQRLFSRTSPLRHTETETRRRRGTCMGSRLFPRTTPLRTTSLARTRHSEQTQTSNTKHRNPHSQKITRLSYCKVRATCETRVGSGPPAGHKHGGSAKDKPKSRRKRRTPQATVTMASTDEEYHHKLPRHSPIYTHTMVTAFESPVCAGNRPAKCAQACSKVLAGTPERAVSSASRPVPSR